MKRVKLLFVPVVMLFLAFMATPPPALADTTDLSVTLEPVISIRVVKNGNDIDTLTLNVDPTASGRFVKDDLSVLVSTSNDTGYTLTFANNDADNSMHHTDTTITTITTAIPSITADSDESSFPINSWGYSLGDITSSTQQFSPIPLSTSAATIKTTTAPTTEDATAVTFAAKVDTSVPAGTYLDTVVFSATTNYVPKDPLDALNSMQDMTASVCNAARIGDEATLTDSRDGKTYNIRKMEDGKCWMVQNLALGDTTKDIILTSSDSDVSANFTIPAGAIQTSGNTDWSTSVDSIHVYDNGNAWIEPTSAGNVSAVHTDGSTPPSQSQYVGNYYNWYTATASTGTAAMASGNASSSICPKGWKLPTSSSTTADYPSLTQALVGINTNTGSTPDKSFTMQSSPNYFILGSFYHSNGISDLGANAAWWSRTVIDSAVIDAPNMNASGVFPQGGGYKYSGLPVRCIADNTITGISTMQEMTSDICAATPTPAASATTVPQATLTDTRDGNTYVVRKLADGNCWMMQNLNLTLSTSVTLNSDTSDLSPGRTWTPQNNTQTTEGTVWAQDGGDVARSMNPGNIYFPGGVGTGTADVYGNLTGSTTGQPWEHVGNYYNWYAATAGTGTAAMTSGNVTDSICPKGWKLPDNLGIKSFVNLVTTTYGLQDNSAADSTKILQSPLNFVRSGHYSWAGGRVDYRGAAGHWWSTAAQSVINASYLYADSSRVISRNAGNKGYGFTIRCVAR